jgi:hypothetical protein
MEVTESEKIGHQGFMERMKLEAGENRKLTIDHQGFMERMKLEAGENRKLSLAPESSRQRSRG